MGMFNGASLSIILLVLTNDPIVVVGVDVIQLLLLVLISFFFDPLPFPRPATVLSQVLLPRGKHAPRTKSPLQPRQHEKIGQPLWRWWHAAVRVLPKGCLHVGIGHRR